MMREFMEIYANFKEIAESKTIYAEYEKRELKRADLTEVR